MQPSEFQTKWSEALRSGRFFQTKGNLVGTASRDHEGNTIVFEDEGELYEPFEKDGQEYDVVEQGLDGHCCLGVGLALVPDPNPEAQDGQMPSRQWCALVGLLYSEAEELAALNDGGSTFDDIGTLIDLRDPMTPYELDTDGEPDYS